MRVVIDVEANSLTNPTKVWCIVCKDIDTGTYSIFRNVTDDEKEKEKALAFLATADLLIGHSIIGYDYPVLESLIGFNPSSIIDICIDTLVVSKLVNYSRKAHSIEDYGLEFGLEKISFNNWTKWSQEMEDYCVRDVDICHKIYKSLEPVLVDPEWAASIRLEQEFQLIVGWLHNNGFAFDKEKASSLLFKVNSELKDLDSKILEAFPPKLKLIREVTPKVTKYGTLNKTDFRWISDGDLSEYNGGPFCRCSWEDFNASSHKQIIEVLSEAGWKPEEKTKTHVETEREINRLKYSRKGEKELDLESLLCKMETLAKYGWKINEFNLNTLPSTAPSPARFLAKRILLESRRRTLVEWLGLVNPDTGRIHGKFYGIGAWTHRMAHQQPNTANIPNEYKEDGTKKLLGKELRSLWRAPKSRLLVGVDAEGIQLRIFAHYIDDKEFTEALINGKKSDKTDPHSLNQRVLGTVCRTRQAAKRFIYALVLGGGIGKLAEILGCSREEADKALSRLLERYGGFAYLKREVIPHDAKRGWFTGLDGRKVRVPGDTVGERKHLMMSGYLQNGEAVVMKRATLKWFYKLKDLDAMLVNLVHDEWQTECPNNMEVAVQIAKMQADSLREVGEDLKLKCPLAGSYWNDDLKDYSINVNWSLTH